jgi:predicted alpha/beta-fold hydrolase
MLAWRAPAWLPGGHAQTIWPARVSRPAPGAAPAWRRERWTLPDGDFVDADLLPPPARGATAAAPAPAPARWIVLLHGLEGGSSGHYALAFAHVAQRAGLGLVVPHFRGCSGEPNREPRTYHSGDFEQVGFFLDRLHRHPALAGGGPPFVCGISLGGNALMRWAQEQGEAAAARAASVVSVSSPLDLAAAGAAIDRGLNRQFYARMFLATMRPKALAKLERHADWFAAARPRARWPERAFDAGRIRRATTMRDFDDAFTAPLFGFHDVEDYWARASAGPHLHRVRIPALAINARNDPFVPAASLPRPGEVGRCVALWQPRDGGHVGFPGGRFPGHALALPELVVGWWRQLG